MKTRIILSVIILSFIFSSKLFSQEETAIPFLLYQPSPTLVAMGATGTAIPTLDPFGFIYNPAQLGYSSQTNNLSFAFYPSKVEWSTFWLTNKIDAYAFNLGYNLKEEINFPLSIGIGYSRVEFNYGVYGSPQGAFETKDYYDAFSIGVGVDYFVQVSAGFTYKDVTSILSDMPSANQTNAAKAEIGVYDLGLLLNVPVLKLIDDEIIWGQVVMYKPFFNFSMGFAKTNIGDKIYYIDPSQADPLPRTDRIGYGINTGMDIINDRIKINMFNLSFTAEADDILIGVRTVGSDSTFLQTREYQSTLSDLQFWKNVVNIRSDNKIVSRAGFALDFFETLTIYNGHFSGRYRDFTTTSGFGIRAKGLFKLYDYIADNPVSGFLAEHVDIRYSNSEYKDLYSERNFNGLSIHIHNFNSLF